MRLASLGPTALAALDASGAAWIAREPARARGFARLDALVRDSATTGLVAVSLPLESVDAVAAHIERRTRSVGREPVRVQGAEGVWCALGARCGAPAVFDSHALAGAIVAAVDERVLIVIETATSSFGRSVSEELARLLGERAGRGLILHLVPAGAQREATTTAAGDALVIDIDGELSGEETVAWWDALARDAASGEGRPEKLAQLERWWRGASSRRTEVAAPELGPAARSLFDRLALVGRALPSSAAAALGEAGALDELLDRNMLALDAEGHLAPRPDELARLSPAARGLPTPAEATLAADALDSAAVDPWALVRVAELRVLAGELERAEASIGAALERVTDAEARNDFWHRWELALAASPGPVPSDLCLRGAVLALRLGDVDRALDLARSAMASSGESHATALVLGRATSARGDLTTASIVLVKALELSADDAERARAAVELADVSYKAGDLETARARALHAIALAGDRATRLEARNLLGKLHLAAAAWEEAERHFAADALEAACGADMVSELRARMNRAIALLSMGRHDEARAMLGTVLEDGERHGELRAVGYGLTNLAILATLHHGYVEALRLSERAIDVFRRIGDRTALMHIIANLAELRLRVGLVAEAEQVLAFGRQVCGPAVPGARAPHFAFVAAQIHLAKGRTAEAMAEVGVALASASGSTNGAKLGECHALAARIALEDGDLGRAEPELLAARAVARSPRASAEVALLEAMLARAAGEPFAEPAREALSVARSAVDLDRTREAHVLLHLAAVETGDDRGARSHLAAAVAIRDQVVQSLPEGLAERFLARRELRELTELAARAGRPDPGSELASETPCPRAPTRPSALQRARFVGEHSAVVALRSAIGKVGRSDATVLVQGESGTGKELVAEALHEASCRRAGPLVKVNCAALVETLLLSELFGHEKGSFTGAAARKRGRFELAEGGTIFLDEIGDISPRTQVALLRVLQDRTYERVGGLTPLRADVRIVCATHRDLRAMVARGEFREDLYYRLRQIVLDVPSLRARPGDLPQIAASLLDRIASERGEAPKRLAPEALVGLTRHGWPGNVRELENALRAATLFAETDTLELEDFTANVEGLRDIDAPASVTPPPASGVAPRVFPESRGAPGSSPGGDPAHGEELPAPTSVAYAYVRGGVSLGDVKREIEHECIARALEESGGNITRAAALLGMKRPRLSQLVKQYGFGGVSEDA